MFNSELFVKCRAYFVLTLFIIILPVFLPLAWIYTILDLCFRLRKFKNIQGEVAVVTGAGHGLGRCIALLLAKKGCNVAIADINLRGAEETVELIKSKYNVKAKAYKIDVSNFEEVEELNKKIVNDLGVVTILINNAGVLVMSNFSKPAAHEVQRMINVNLAAHFWTNRVFLENMKAQKKGHIVAVCSIAGLAPLPTSGPYAATKFGVRGLMRTLRLDLKSQGFNDIHATTFFPAFLKTNDEVIGYSKEAAIGDLYPLISGEEAALAIVNGMLRNEAEVLLPKSFTIMSRVFDLLPPKVQDAFYLLLTKKMMNNLLLILKREQKMLEVNEK